MANKIWFITGCSTGFGRELSIVAANNGCDVVGTLRNQSQIEEYENLVPGKITGVLMDVTNYEQVKNAIDLTFQKFGRVDVLVNNAGYGSLGSVEDISHEEMRKQFEVNVYGPVEMIKKVLPIMRNQQSGHIINITSIGGLQGYPGVGIYNGSKFALEGIGEALEKDIQPLGIHVTNVEPGPFRTDWAGRSATYTESSIDVYRDSAVKNMNDIRNVSGQQIGNPVKGSEAIYKLTELENPPMHLPLGGPAYSRARSKFTSLLKEIDDFEYLGLPTDYPESE